MIQFCVLIGKSPSETRQLLRTAYGNECFCRTQVFLWHKRFRDGRGDVVDLPRASRSKTGRTPENVQAVKDLIEGDRRLSVGGISAITGIAHTTVFRILRRDLLLRRRAAKFIPRLLTIEQMNHWMSVCKRLLQRTAVDKSFFSRVITMDETWAYQYDPELKTQSSQWIPKGGRHPIKAMRSRATGKVLLVSFFDQQGMIHIEFLCRTVGANLFVDILRRLRDSIRMRRGKRFLRDCWLYMDNAPAHTANITKQFLIQTGMRVLEHPPYSPDLAPSDFWLYRRLKKPLRGKRYDNMNALKAAVRQEIGNIASHEYLDCIQNQWPRHWARCVHNGGSYFEGVK